MPDSMDSVDDERKVFFGCLSCVYDEDDYGMFLAAHCDKCLIAYEKWEWNNA
jgi:hypothetical protein